MLPIRDTVPSRHPPIAMVGLIAVNVLVFLLEVRLPEEHLERLFHAFGLVPVAFVRADWPWRVRHAWPFLTSMFLHAGWAHFFGNMWTLWIFGDNVEDRMGPGRFVLFYIVCGVAAGVVHVVVNPDSPVPTVGASGAIAGVMGAYFVLFPLARIILLMPVLFVPVFVQLPAVVYIGLWMWSQVLSGLAALAVPHPATGVAFWAHIGGFAAGAATFWLFLRPRPERRRVQADEWGMEGAWGARPGRWRW